jgi:hypothetical protein
MELIGMMEGYINFGVKDAKIRKIPEDIYILYNNVYNKNLFVNIYVYIKFP